MRGADRLSLALDARMFALPDGVIAVYGATSAHDLSALPRDRVQIVQGFHPDHAFWADSGYQVLPEPPKTAALSVIYLPRSKALARHWIATAARVTKGAIVIDGQKTDGVDSIFKAVRGRAETSAALSKAHGKLFVITSAGEAFEDWITPPEPGPEGFVTAPGVFSEAKVDRGSQLLATALPPKLAGRVADFGAGWGYLSAAILKNPGVTELHLVEADHMALACSQQNITDARAQFHWDDATRITFDVPLDWVVMNPPFHTGRAGDPDLGRAFITNAARELGARGQLVMVANRHLPYEATLGELFRRVEEFGGDGGFKLLIASGPLTAARKAR